MMVFTFDRERERERQNKELIHLVPASQVQLLSNQVEIMSKRGDAFTLLKLKHY